MLQNRVDPFGNLIRTPARGAWTGTRGVIHNDMQEITRPYKLKAWLTCKLEFKGRKRKVMSPERYTELFFLDEATAFAAGHRPCCECRRDDFDKFKSLWLAGNPEYNFDKKTSIQKIDDVLHGERINKHKSKVTFEENFHNIPNGTFILYNENPFLVMNNQMFLWTPFGYAKEISLPKTNKLIILTPKSVVNTFNAGYSPQIHIGA
jgi:hypothetical protein